MQTIQKLRKIITNHFILRKFTTPDFYNEAIKPKEMIKMAQGNFSRHHLTIFIWIALSFQFMATAT